MHTLCRYKHTHTPFVFYYAINIYSILSFQHLHLLAGIKALTLTLHLNFIFFNNITKFKVNIIFAKQLDSRRQGAGPQHYAVVTSPDTIDVMTPTHNNKHFS